MTGTYMGPGDPLGQHQLAQDAHTGLFAPIAHLTDPTAHAALFATKAAATDIGASAMVSPFMAFTNGASTAVWFLANQAIMQRFSLPVRTNLRWVNLWVGVSSGNVQASISRVTRAGTVVTTTRVATTGIVACPTLNAAARLDLGAGGVNLDPGDYTLNFWCDNITATFQHSLVTGMAGMRANFSPSSAQAAGIGSAALTVSPTTRWMALTAESDS